METVQINGSERKELGKKGNKQLRREGKVPCVIYGGENPVHFSAPAGAFRPIIYTPKFKIAEIKVGSDTYKCILKDTQMHPVTDELVHVDFIELVPNKQIKVEVPVKFVGTSPGVKNGGKLISNLRRIKIKTTPESLTDHLVLDISSLLLGHAIRVRDIETVEGVQIINSPSIPVASVEIPRALKSAAAGEEGVEGEEGAPAEEEEAAATTE